MSEEIHSEQAYQTAQQQIAALKSNIQQVVHGQQSVIEQVITSFLANGHILLEGVPGLGKTLLVQAFSRSLSLQCKRIQFTPDMMPADITGHSMLVMHTGQFEVRKGPVFTNLLLADEINRAPAKTQAALLEVMQERQVTIDGETFAVGNPFMVLATQNPLDSEGTYPLPEAELDRFLMKVVMDYPSQEEEIQLAMNNNERHIADRVGQLDEVLNESDLTNIRQLIKAVTVDEAIVRYAVELVRATRQWSGITHGAGVRASLALVECAKATAVAEGSNFVTPDMIKRLTKPILRHRIILSADREISGDQVDEVINEIVSSVAAPRQ